MTEPVVAHVRDRPVRQRSGGERQQGLRSGFRGGRQQADADALLTGLTVLLAPVLAVGGERDAPTGVVSVRAWRRTSRSPRSTLRPLIGDVRRR